MGYGGVQLLRGYHERLSAEFLPWYAKNFKSSRMCYLHWSVEGLCEDDGHYHIVVAADRTYHNTPVSEDLVGHTWGRNHNSFAVAFSGFVDAQTSDLGSQVPAPEQIRRFVAETARALVNLRMPVSSVMTHAEAADNVDQGLDPPYDTPGMGGDDAAPYGPMSTWERWDLHVWIDPITLQLHPPKVAIPRGSVYFPDWARGEIALEIQDMTKHRWKK